MVLSIDAIKAERKKICADLDRQEQKVDALKVNLSVWSSIFYVAFFALYFFSENMGFEYTSIAAVMLSAAAVTFAFTQAAWNLFFNYPELHKAKAWTPLVASGLGLLFIVVVIASNFSGAIVGTLFGVVFVAAFAHEVWFRPEFDLVETLKYKLYSLAEITPEETPGLCNMFSEWIDEEEPLALELYENLNGRRPTIREINETRQEIENRKSLEREIG